MRAAGGQLTGDLGTHLFSELHQGAFCQEDVPLCRWPWWMMLGVPLLAGRRDHIPECGSEAVGE